MVAVPNSVDQVIPGTDGDDVFKPGLGNTTLQGMLGNDSVILEGLGGDTIDITANTGGHKINLLSGTETRARIDAQLVQTIVLNQAIARLNLNGDASASILDLRQLPQMAELHFGDGGGEDQIALDKLVVAGDSTLGLTQSEFEDLFFLIRDASTGLITLEVRSTGQQVMQLSGLETLRFSDGEGASDVVGIGDIAMQTVVARAQDVGTGGAVNEFYQATSSMGENVDGGGGNDLIRGSTGNDTIAGGTGKDTLRGGAGEDTLKGGADDDIMTDATGATIDGGDGKDIATTLAGNNTLTDSGTVANKTSLEIDDAFFGGLGDDSLSGGEGNDILIADAASIRFAGNDTIDGGIGIDLFMGGYDADVFLFEAHDSTATGVAGDAILGADIIGRFERADIANEFAQASPMIMNLTPVGADFQIGIDLVQLVGVSAITRAAMQADLAPFVTQTAQGAQFEAEGIRILFAQVDAADILAADLNDVFDFI